MIPGSPTSRNGWITDLITVDLAENKTALDDNYAWSRYERPYTSEDMEYRDYLDIMRAEMQVRDPWIYFTIVLIGKIPFDKEVRYGVELDVDHDGRGDFLLTVAPPLDTNWTTDGVRVIADEDDDVGGLYPLYMEDPIPGTTGYEKDIFTDGEGADRDLAWVRMDPDAEKGNQIQIAVKESLVGTLGFMWNAWADGGLLDPAMFDYNDQFTFEEAGSSNKDNYRWPVKAVALLDTTCRSWYGYVPSGAEPGICFGEEQIRPSPPGYGWCLANANTTDCGGAMCKVKCPEGRFCVPCKLP
jgi:hypothetical protein